jgi:DNA-binding NarL/FixJ family response regulator
LTSLIAVESLALKEYPMIQILCLYEQHIPRALLEALDAEPDMRVVEVVNSPQVALRRLQLYRCNLLLMTIERFSEDFFHFIRQVTQQTENPQVLVINMLESHEPILQSFQSGAIGYLLQDDPLEEVLYKVRAAHEKKAILSPEIAAALIVRLRELTQHRGAPFLLGKTGPIWSDISLTRREQQILRHIEKGHSNQKIADDLGIAYGTVANHIHNLFTKIGVNHRREAALLAGKLLPMMRKPG